MGLLVSLILNALALIITAYIVPGIKVDAFTTAILAAIVIAVINTFVKPILLLLTLPLTVLTLGLFLFVVNAIVLRLTTLVVSGFQVDGWLPAILGAIVLSITSTVLSTLVKDFALKGKK